MLTMGAPMSFRFAHLFASLALALGLSLAPAACAGQTSSSPSQQCANGLSQAYEELKTAKANGLGGTVAWTKAAGLLAAAKVQYEFLHYPNCINKVERARVLLKAAAAH